MIILLLIAHILIGLALLVAFMVRFVMVLAKRISSNQVRGLILSLTSALVLSGFLLVLIAHSPLTGACLSSLVIIAVVGALEGALQLFGRKLTT